MSGSRLFQQLMHTPKQLWRSFASRSRPGQDHPASSSNMPPILKRLRGYYQDYRKTKPTPSFFSTALSVAFTSTLCGEYFIREKWSQLPQQPTEAGHIVLPSPQELDRLGISRERYEDMGQLAIQAARDLGNADPILLTFVENQRPNEKPASALAAWRSLCASEEMSFWFSTFYKDFPPRGDKVHIIQINDAMVKKATPGEIYAVAGQGHVLSDQEHYRFLGYSLVVNFTLCQHLIKKIAPHLFFKMPVLPSLYLAININNFISQCLISNADRISAQKLGSARYLSSALETNENNLAEKQKEFLEEHMANFTLGDYALMFGSLMIASFFVLPTPTISRRIKQLNRIQDQPGYAGNIDYLTLMGKSEKRDNAVKVSHENDAEFSNKPRR